MARGYNNTRVWEYACLMPSGSYPAHRAEYVGADLLEGNPDDPDDRGLLYDVFRYKEACVKIEIWRQRCLHKLMNELAPDLKAARKAYTDKETEIENLRNNLQRIRQGAKKRVRVSDLEAQIKEACAEAEVLRKEKAELERRVCVVTRIRKAEAQYKNTQMKLDKAESEDKRSRIEKDLQKQDEKLKSLRELLASLSKKEARIAHNFDRREVEIHDGTNEKYRRIYAQKGLGRHLYTTTKTKVSEAVKSARRRGGVAEDKVLRWDGTGAFHVQIKKTAKGPITVERALSGELINSCLQILPMDPYPPIKDKKGKIRRDGKKFPLYKLRMRVLHEPNDPETGEGWVEIPFVYHRPFPQGAVITGVALRRRDLRDRKQWHAQFTIKREHFDADVADTGRCGIDVGWRSTNEVCEHKSIEQGIRFGYLYGADGFQMPLVLPNHMFMDRWQACERARSEKDQEFDKFREELNEWRKQTEGLPNWFLAETETLGNWKSPKRLAKLVYKWQENRFDGDEAMLPRAREWRKLNKRLWKRYISNHRRTKERRNDFYRKAARGVARRYRDVYVADIDLRKMARSAKPEEEGESAEVRYAMRYAAVGTFIEFLVKAGVRVHKVNPSVLRACNYCGFAPERPSPRLHQRCESCGSTWDLDANQAANLCDSAVHDGNDQRVA